MKVFDIYITRQVGDYLCNNLEGILCFDKANKKMYDSFGIIDFFANDKELEDIRQIALITNDISEDINRSEYGDFQTNKRLADDVTSHLLSRSISPQIVIEPTCGKGNFIIASLKKFQSINHIFGIEIYKPYIWETKFNIISFFLEYPNNNKPDITLNHCSVFDFPFKQIAQKFSDKYILIIGNPPWVTNSKLGSLDSLNLPRKVNIKHHSGLDAMTGKSNFDIAESITLNILEVFQKSEGNLLFLIKNSVIRNIVLTQKKSKYSISNIEKYTIDSKKEFNVSVEASLFYCKLNSEPEFYCKEFNFYNNQSSCQQFGWTNDKFVSNLQSYSLTKSIDGISPFVWRQGLKHDCSTIMELEKTSHLLYLNRLNEDVKLEEDLVYGLIKSSDLKNMVINDTRKYTIVTQRKVGEETRFIKNDYPNIYKYLSSHLSIFNSRKSSIYKNKPLFSIFGIGEYSFKPYKVAISGLYKTFHFTLLLPQNNKPIMLDDTCYFIGFDNIEFAAYTLILLNLPITKQFLQSITFVDAKRTFTKDILMRIDFFQLSKKADRHIIESELNKLNYIYNLGITFSLWDKFIEEIKQVNRKIQYELFV